MPAARRGRRPMLQGHPLRPPAGRATQVAAAAARCCPGPVFAGPTPSDRTRCRASSSATSTRARPASRRTVSISTSGRRLCSPRQPIPVMVWIHGGGFVVGSGAEPRYDGTNLAAKAIVVVTLNHRLNALGFLAHPELTAELPVRALRQLRHARPRRGTRVGEAKHPRPSAAIPAADHHRRRVRRLRGRQRADGVAACPRLVPPRDRRRAAPCSRPRAVPRPSLDDAERAGCEFMRQAQVPARSPNCGRCRRKTYSPRRPASASGPSSTATSCRDLRPRSSPKAPRTTSPCWRGGTRTRASTSPCCRATMPTAPIRTWSRGIFADAREEALGHYPGGSRNATRPARGRWAAT